MGVPKFYRWISERYPNISHVVNDNQIPDFDNFYLDMNGIIHSCSHINESNSEMKITEKEIFRNIFHYIDFLFRMIKPKKVFFMAIDGVAPRAKMNQQRSRRFRAGRERVRKLKRLAEENGKTLEEIAEQYFDTNSITPGTNFMSNLHEQLKYFINVKLTTDPLWENVNVHLSSHLTPGEGEHKIMEYIRYTRSQPGYNVNTKHCLYGLDADLIMLGLVTHEMHFALLREEIKYGGKKTSKILMPEEINWHLLHTCLLRDYIDLEFRSLKDKLKFPYNLENIIDDWIFMAYLVGNDFIPHLPHLHINEEALTILWDTYKNLLPTLDGYLNESGDLNLERFEIYITELAKFDHQRYENENDSFKHLKKLEKPNKTLRRSKSQNNKNDFDFSILEKLSDPISSTDAKKDFQNENIEHKSSDSSGENDDDDEHLSDSDANSEKSNDNENKNSFHIPINENDMENLPLIEAEFRQHKNHYYRNKMKINLTSVEQLSAYVEQYIQALQWILKYYYQGCPSWSWFYPNHYAPYLSDLKNFKHLQTKFEKGKPFQPYEQLLSVLPPSSRNLLPKPLQSLMIDSDSPLLSFYPENFELDQNEKKKDWEAIVLLPFIDEQLLLKTISKYYDKLSVNELEANQYAPSLCFHSTLNLQAAEKSLEENSYFPPLKQTRAICEEYPHDFYRSDKVQYFLKRFQDKDMIIFPKFPILNVLPYKYDYKRNAVTLFESKSKEPTLVLKLIHQFDKDCVTYNNQWKPNEKDNDNKNPPFKITNIHLLIERYLGKRVFVNWPHFQQGIVCAVSDYKHIYTWKNIPGGSYFHFEPINNELNQNYKNFIQTPIYVSQFPFEVPIDYNKKAVYTSHQLDGNHIESEYTKAYHINRTYENQQGISIGPIPVLLYVSPLIGYRTKTSSTTDKCQITMCFLNQALAYPLQTTLFELPNYKYEYEHCPKTIYDYFKSNDLIFSLKAPYYSSTGHVQQVNIDYNGKYVVSCQMESSDTLNQPSIHELIPKFNENRLKYYTAQELADRFKVSPCTISKITGNINVIGKRVGRRQRVNPTNIGLAWKANKPLKELRGYTKKIDQIWCYTDAAASIINDYITKFPEIIADLERRPQDDNYYEANIWPTKKSKYELQQVRLWFKSLPTYSIPLTDGAWKILDSPVVNTVDTFVKSFYEKRSLKNPQERTKLITSDPSYLFKADEYLGMCDPDIGTYFDLFDRVITVRPGAGVPIGTRGTIVGIRSGQTISDTYYEVLFDKLPPNCLDSILLDKNQQKGLVKVRSYYLLNYSHSLRMRSMNYYHHQRSFNTHYVDMQRQFEYPSSSSRHYHQEPHRSSKMDSDETNRTKNKPKSAPHSTTKNKPKSAPPSTTNNKPMAFLSEPNKSNTNDQSINLPAVASTSRENLSDSEISAFSSNIAAVKEPTVPTNTPTDNFLASRFQDTQQNEVFQHSVAWPSVNPTIYSGPLYQPQFNEPYQAQFMYETMEYMAPTPSNPWNNQLEMNTQLEYANPIFSPIAQFPDETWNPMYPNSVMIADTNTTQNFLPYDINSMYPEAAVIDPSVAFNDTQGFPIDITTIPIPTDPFPPTPVLQQFPPTPPVSQQFPSSPPVSQQFPSSPPVSQQFPSSPPVSQQFPSSPPLPQQFPPNFQNPQIQHGHYYSPNPSVSHQSSPFAPQETNSAPRSLQFVPSQVLRNLPKK